MTTHAHRFIIDSPNGRWSWGACDCGEGRWFDNRPPDTDMAVRAPKAQAASAEARKFRFGNQPVQSKIEGEGHNALNGDIQAALRQIGVTPGRSWDE